MKDESAADPPLDQGSGPAQQPGETLTERRLVTRHRRVRRPLGAGYWLTALAVAAALVAATTYTQRDGVETALAADVDKRLAARGLGKVEVTLEGRVVTAAVPAGEDTEKVERTVDRRDRRRGRSRPPSPSPTPSSVGPARRSAVSSTAPPTTSASPSSGRPRA